MITSSCPTRAMVGRAVVQMENLRRAPRGADLFLVVHAVGPSPVELAPPPVPPNSSLISRYNSTKSWVRNGKCAPWFKVMPPLAHAEGDKWIVHSNGEWTNTHGLGDWQVGLVSSFMLAAAARRNCILSSPRAFLWTVP